MLSSRVILLLALGIWLAVLPLDGARPQGLGILDPLHFQEDFTNTVALGPALIHGVAIGDLEPAVEVGQIAVDFAGGIANRLCVSMLSIDGRYWARLEFDISNRRSGTYQVRFPTTHAADLRRYRRYEVAVNPILSDQCDDGTIRGFGAVLWAPREPATQVALLINASGLRTILEVPDRDGGSIKYQCGPLAGHVPGPFYYDTVCNAEIDSSLDLQRARLIRYRLDGKPPIDVPVAISLQ
jgi:hypothetical protein